MKKVKLTSKKVVKKASLAKKPKAKKVAVKAKTEIVPQHTRMINGKKRIIKAFKRKPKS